MFLDNASYISTTSDTAGNIDLTGKNIILDKGSGIIANTTNMTENGINIRASDTLQLKGTSGQFNDDLSFFESEKLLSNGIPTEEINNFYSVSFISAYIFSDAAKPVSNTRIDVKAKNLEVFDAAQIRTVGLFTDNRSASDISIRSSDITVQGDNNIDSLAFSSIAGGNVDIFSESLTAAGGGRIVADTFNAENSGQLFVRSNSIDLRGSTPLANRFSGLFLNAIRNSGEASITVDTSKLSIIDGAKIRANGVLNNDAGNIDITADSIVVSGFVPSNTFPASAIASSVDIRVSDVDRILEEASQSNQELANAGKIDIDTRELKILDGARIVSSNNIGDSGNININAQDIKLDGTRPEVFAFIGGLSTSTRSSSLGKGGEININTNSLKY